MKGFLHKTEQGWVVKYDQRTWQDPSAEDGELPLHPTDLGIPSHIGHILGEVQEVEFEIVEGCCTPESQIKRYVDCKGCDKKQNYAKLINFQTVPLPVFQQLPTSVLEQDVVETMARDFYWSRQPKGKFMAESSRPDMVIGYVEGYNRAKEDLFTEEQMLGFLDFYNSFDFNKPEYKYQHPSMDGSEKDYNKNIDKKILKQYIQSLKQHK
jgi:hypothetical protein